MSSVVYQIMLSSASNEPFRLYQEDNLRKLIQSLQSPNRIDAENESVIKLFKTKDLEVVPLLIKALKDPDSKIRMGAALVLGYRNEKSAVIPLIECLEDGESLIRATAANSLKKLKDPRAVKPLIKCLNDEASEVRISATIALGSIFSEDAIKALRDVATNHIDIKMREIAQVFLNRVK